MMQKTTDILIIGGGASGLAAAVAAKRTAPQLDVTILEKNAKVGKKLLATGNGRCNLGNSNLKTKAFYGSCTRLLPSVLENTLSSQQFFRTMGLCCRKDLEGRLYPHSNQAVSVLDALRLSCEQLAVHMICDSQVVDFSVMKEQFMVSCSECDYHAKAVICAFGGFAAPKTGSDGNAFAWMRKLGHHTTDTLPALVPFYTVSKLTQPLKGVRIAAEVSACTKEGKCLFRERGEVQFNAASLSGICVMNLSAMCIQTEPDFLSLNLLPDDTLEQVGALLWELYGTRTEWFLEDWLTGMFSKKVGIQLLRNSGIQRNATDKVYLLTPQEIEQVAYCCQNWCFPVIGRGNWQEAQVTAGGISVDQIDDSLQSLYCKGLFFSGEMLDIHGVCGGYNLEWAWRSGQLAAQNAVKFCAGEKLE